MKDLATYRIYTAWLWILHYKSKIAGDGFLLGPEVTENVVILSMKVDPVSAGSPFNKPLFEKICCIHY